ncbi:MAG: cytochrome-c peroxidase [Chitinophagaceae bacterium]
MNKKLLLMLGVATGLCLLISCGSSNDTTMLTHEQADSLQKVAQAIFQPIPKVIENPANPITLEKVYLGKVLYYDTKLSKSDKDVSCNSCHNLSNYGTDGLQFSKNDFGGPDTPRNCQTSVAAALAHVQFWDGRAKDVEEQAGGPILNHVEMDMPNEKYVEDRLRKVDYYQTLFAKAFPNEKQPINYNNIKKAIGAFERTLMPETRFDEYLKGNQSALTDAEQQGLRLFIAENCIMCHKGVSLAGDSNMIYQKFGMVIPEYWTYTKSKNIDKGRFLQTNRQEDIYFFKIPGLRNVEKTAPYFHDGSVDSLDEAVKIMGKVQLNKDLTPEQIKSIVLFLNTLTADLPDSVKIPPKEVAKK